MANGDDDFQGDALQLRHQVVQLGLAFGLQHSLVEVEQGVSSESDLLARNHRRSHRSRSRSGHSRSQGAVAQRVGRGRGPGAVAPAELVRAILPHVLARTVAPVVVHCLLFIRDGLSLSGCSHYCGSCNERELGKFFHISPLRMRSPQGYCEQMDENKSYILRSITFSMWWMLHFEQCLALRWGIVPQGSFPKK
ncbi:protein of unknown function [Cupriavidus taiwanensis]|uniref:Uncharacterized protein n=1 Tax=Cupriavidus taiwanensis TaxID=164546 RepID=A0A375DGH2_9BURK|nr:protein of unknown function [Cupriavidus taiwanensis]SOZ04764.1 hypothetical protein CBM2597_A50716 [Cupriavidus taiwanensis]SPC06822.1 hypothetical protein CT19431_160066 [Cupriavidus taiwanensis]SPC09247.1 hypothetical protein CBM2594_A40570 [Cupriavidus taiwanensis]